MESLPFLLLYGAITIVAPGSLATWHHRTCGKYVRNSMQEFLGEFPEEERAADLVAKEQLQSMAAKSNYSMSITTAPVTDRAMLHPRILVQCPTESSLGSLVATTITMPPTSDLLPDTASWMNWLMGVQPSWWTACISSRHVVSATNVRSENPFPRIFQPLPGWSATKYHIHNGAQAEPLLVAVELKNLQAETALLVVKGVGERFDLLLLHRVNGRPITLELQVAFRMPPFLLGAPHHYSAMPVCSISTARRCRGRS
jgi:hypothetical protein